MIEFLRQVAGAECGLKSMPLGSLIIRMKMLQDEPQCLGSTLTTRVALARLANVVATRCNHPDFLKVEDAQDVEG